jgi:hypothetical protein
MPPLEPRDHRISLADARAHTRRHRESLGRGKHEDADHGGAFHADQVLAILAQKGCSALRIYHGRHENGRRSLVLVGVDKDNKDMSEGLICELCFFCPPYCDASSPLLTG